MMAAEKGHHEVVKVLLDKGAKINKADKVGAPTHLWVLLRNCNHANTILLPGSLYSRRQYMFAWPFINSPLACHACIVVTVSVCLPICICPH